MSFLSFIKKYGYIIAASLLLLFFFLASYTSTHGLNLKYIKITPESLTYDEEDHIGSSYQYAHDMKSVLNPEHPILIKIIVGIPLQFMHLNQTSYSYSSLIKSKDDNAWDYGKQLIFTKNLDKTNAIINTARTTVLILNIIMLSIVTFLAYKIFSKRVSLLLLAFIIFNPTILGHASLVTFDVPALLSSLITILCFIGFIRNNNPKWAAYTGFAAGIASCIKYSSFALVLFILISYIIYALFMARINRNIRKAFKNISIFILMLLLTIIAIYLPYTYQIKSTEEYFQIFNIWPGHLNLFSKPLITFLNNFSGPTKALAVWIDGLFITNLEVGVFREAVFFLGQNYEKGNYLLGYFPLLFLTKNPISEILLFLASIILTVKTYRKSTFKYYSDEIAILIYSILYFALALYSKLKLGVRHLLPFIGTLSLFSAVVLDKNWSRKLFNIKISTLAYVLLFLSFLSSIISFPHYISYYNYLVGGSNNAYNIAEDSNYDWGQDLIYLAKWKNEHPTTKLYYDITPLAGAEDFYLTNDKSLYVTWYKNNVPSGDYIAVDSGKLTLDQSTKNINYRNLYHKKIIRLTPTIFIFEK